MNLAVATPSDSRANGAKLTCGSLTQDNVDPDLCDRATSPIALATPITVLVHEYANGDKAALDRLLPLVHAQLRRTAQKHLRDERPGHTLHDFGFIRGTAGRISDLGRES